MKKPLVLCALLAACTTPETGTLQSRQGGMVIYDTKTAFVPIQSPAADTFRSRCSGLLERFFKDWSTSDKTDRGEFFGALYGAYKDGQCTVASESNGSSIAEISSAVKTHCEAVFLKRNGFAATCTPVFHSVPHGVTVTSGKTLGYQPGRDFLKELRSAGGKFGATTISLDGAWNTVTRGTRAEADAEALRGCREVTGNGYDDVSQEYQTRLRNSCKVIYRFGPDFPGAENVTVIKG